MSVKDPAIIYLKYQEEQLVLSDNEGHHSEKGKEEDFTTFVSPNGKVAWKIADNSITKITDIAIDSGKGMFEKLPFEEKDGTWEAKIDKKHSKESKYSITFIPEGQSEPITIDPKLETRP